MSRRILRGRIREAEELLAAGVDPAATAHQLSARYGVGRRQGERYVRRAFELWAADDKEHRHTRKLRLRHRLDDFYLKAIEAGQYGPALQALDRLARLDGLYAPESIRVQHGGDPDAKALSMTTEEIRRRVDQLLDERAALVAVARHTKADVAAPN